MRLSVVNPAETGGGAELQIQFLAAALAAAGRHEIAYHARQLGPSTHPRPYQLMPVRPGQRVSRLGYLPDARALVRSLEEFGPDVIYQRVACAWTGICAWYARRSAARLVWHVAHDSDVTPHEHLSGHNPLRRVLEKRAIEYGLRRADAIIVQTQHQAGLLRRHYGREADAVIANFHPPATEVIDKSGPPVVAWIANLKPMKRPEVFVRLAAALSDLTDVRFVMAGADQTAGAPTAWRRLLQDAFAAGGNLQYRGPVSQADANTLLARAVVFVNTSTREGFPNTFVQAWLRDAVVCSLTVDPDGALSRRGLGILAGDEDTLAAGLRRLLRDAELRSDFVSRARAAAIADHGLGNAERIVAMLEGRYPERADASIDQ
jgi:glycosyltransferase involved in cell wall biosynthesis